MDARMVVGVGNLVSFKEDGGNLTFLPIQRACEFNGDPWCQDQLWVGYLMVSPSLAELSILGVEIAIGGVLCCHCRSGLKPPAQRRLSGVIRSRT